MLWSDYGLLVDGEGLKIGLRGSRLPVAIIARWVCLLMLPSPTSIPFHCPSTSAILTPGIRKNTALHHYRLASTPALRNPAVLAARRQHPSPLLPQYHQPDYTTNFAVNRCFLGICRWGFTELGRGRIFR